MSLVELPRDILLHVLHLLHVHDILALERTCTALRSTVASRHLWLLKLLSLDQPCAPDLPQYADVERLSCRELRGAVTRAIRWFEMCKKGMAASLGTRLSSVQLEEQWPSPIHSLYGFPVRLAPGGKLLVINHQGFTAISVQTGRCICKWGGSALIPAAAHIFNIFKVDHPPGAEARAVKVAAYECPSEPRSLALIFDVALDGRFGVASISKNQVSKLLLWNWQSGQVVEAILERGLRLGNFQISNGWLFYMLTKSIGDRHIKLGTLALSELFLLRSSVVNLDDIQASYAILDRPDGIERLCGVLHLALCDFSANFSNVIQLCIMIEVEVVDSEMPHIIAYRYAFDLQNTADCKTSSLYLVHHTAPRTYNSPAFEEPTLRVDGAGDRSGKIVHVAARVTGSFAGSDRPGILYPARECLLVGIDEYNELFLTPVSQRPWEGHIKTFIDDHGGGLVRLDVRNGTTHIDVHYVS